MATAAFTAAVATAAADAMPELANCSPKDKLRRFLSFRLLGILFLLLLLLFLLLFILLLRLGVEESEDADDEVVLSNVDACNPRTEWLMRCCCCGGSVA